MKKYAFSSLASRASKKLFGKEERRVLLEEIKDALNLMHGYINPLIYALSNLRLNRINERLENIRWAQVLIPLFIDHVDKKKEDPKLVSEEIRAFAQSNPELIFSLGMLSYVYSIETKFHEALEGIASSTVSTFEFVEGRQFTDSLAANPFFSLSHLHKYTKAFGEASRWIYLSLDPYTRIEETEEGDRIYVLTNPDVIPQLINFISLNLFLIHAYASAYILSIENGLLISGKFDLSFRDKPVHVVLPTQALEQFKVINVASESILYWGLAERIGLALQKLGVERGLPLGANMLLYVLISAYPLEDIWEDKVSLEGISKIIEKEER